MPLSNLKVETNMNGTVKEDESWQTYTVNQQMKRNDAPGASLRAADHSQAKTMPVVGPKPVKVKPTKQDEALTKANTKDLKTRNIK